MQVIGVTGISGAGKSTVSEKICEMTSGKHINADEVTKKLRRKRRRVL
ncbi:MAG: dephospho-CoA kinase [Clostridia bacterium]|nr:dephospho-CoA kinase [Clostridia bacterium]